MIIKTEAFLDILRGFHNSEEFATFRNELYGLTEDMCYAFFKLEEEPDPELRIEQHLKQMFIFALFCREHFEIIRDMIGKLEFQEVTEAERDALLDSGNVLDLDDSDD